VKILHVMECTIGGTRRHLVDAARGQRRAGLDVHLVAATLRDPDLPADLDALEREGVLVTRLDMLRAVNPVQDYRHYRALKSILRRWRPDVVHTHSSKAGVLGRRASMATGIGARVHTPHTFAFLFEALFSRPKRWLYRAIESRLARSTELMIAVGRSEAETFAASGVVPAEKVRVVPNGIDVAPFEGAAPADLAAFGLDPARPTAAIIGLVYAAKGQDLALDALAAAACPELQFLVVGPGDRSDVEVQTERLGLTERVAFTGPRRDVPALLAAADFLVLPSRWEGMPYIVLEAMASGLPVLATPVDGARELILPGRTGLLAESIGSQPLARGLEVLCALSPSERAAMGAAGRDRVREGYTIAAMVEGLIAVYREVT